MTDRGSEPETVLLVGIAFTHRLPDPAQEVAGGLTLSLLTAECHRTHNDAKLMKYDVKSD